MKLFRPKHTLVGSTARLEAYSDAVIAIIVTILVLEIHPPELHGTTLHDVFAGLRGILPQLTSFALSFLTVSVFWVNHHHFFHELDRTDGALLWYNNGLLFFLSLVPFTTAFLGHYPTVPGAVMVYCANLFFAALAFTLMSRHALCSDDIIAHEISDEERHAGYARSWVGTVLYGVGVLAAPWALWLSAVIMLIVPLYYTSPRLVHDHTNI